jgi:hypothetical protein
VPSDRRITCMLPYIADSEGDRLAAAVAAG